MKFAGICGSLWFFVDRKAVIIGQVVKWQQLMPQRKVDGMGLKAVPWRNTTRSSSFWCVVMTL